jgi:hypothetical protein
MPVVQRRKLNALFAGRLVQMAAVPVVVVNRPSSPSSGSRCCVATRVINST